MSLHPALRPAWVNLKIRVTSLLIFSLSTLMMVHTAQAETFKIKDDRGAPIATLEISESNLLISYQEGGGSHRMSAKRGGDKHKYIDAYGVKIAKIKTKSEGFKLYGESEKALFKVKGDYTKLKVVISSDEAHPLKIKDKGEKLKVYRVNHDQQTVIGQIKLSGDRRKVKVKDASKLERFYIHSSHLSSAYGLLLDDRIQAQYRYILMIEILLRQHPQATP